MAYGGKTLTGLSQSVGPATFAQEALWLMERLYAGGAVNNNTLLIRTEATVDSVVLEAAFRVVTARHPSLRTAFDFLDEELVQHVSPTGRVDFGARPLPRAGSDEKLRAAVRAESAKQFDLAVAPLLRLRLFELDESGAAILLVVHHLIADGPSLRLIVDQLLDAYATLLAGDEPDTTSQDPTMLALAVAQRERFAEGRLSSKDEARVAATLGKALPPTRVDKRVPGRRSFACASEVQSVDGSTARELFRVGRKLTITPFMIYAASFGAALAYYCAVPEILIGTPATLRLSRELDEVAGLLVNIVPLRLSLRHGDSLATHLARSAEACLSAYSLAEIPFELIVRSMIGGSRPPGRRPLVQAGLVLEDALPPRWDTGGMVWDAIPLEPRAAKFDLALAIEIDGDGLCLRCLYDPELYEQKSAALIVRLTRNLVMQYAHDIDLPVLAALDS